MNKKTILLVFAIAFQFYNAQNVSFKDENLKKVILSKHSYIDANKDGEISFEEAEKVTSLRLNDPVAGKGITSIEGIEAFTNLTELNLGYNKIAEIDVSKLLKLSILNLRNNQLSGTLDVGMLQNLKNLELNNNKLSKVILPKQNKLNILYVNGNQLTELDLTGLTALKRMTLVRNNIAELNLQDNVVLEFLHLEGNHLENLSIAGLSKLKWMSVANNQLTNISFEGNTALKSILANNNKLTELDFYDKKSNNITLMNIDENPDFKRIIKDSFDVITVPSGVEVVDGNTLSTAEFSEGSVAIFPNPATDFLFVKSRGEVVLKMYDFSGKLVLMHSGRDEKISLSSIPSGIYFLKIKSKNVDKSMKLIIKK